MAKEFLALYSKNCKSCAYLDPAETKRYKTCHHTKGNTECPAAEVQLIVVGKAKALAARLRDARVARDAAAEVRILQFLNKQSEPYKSRFYDALDSLGRDSSCQNQKPR